MKDLIKVLAVIFAVVFVIRFCRANFSDMTAKETYVSTNDKHIMIELTEEKKTTIHDNSAIEGAEPTVEEVGTIAYLHVNGEVYEGTYSMFISNKLHKELWVDFEDQGLCHTNNPGSKLSEFFYVKGNRIVVKDKKGFYTNQSIFKENNTFKKKTWWNTWGLKLCIILIIAFIIWLLRVPELITNKKFRETCMNDFKESKKEYDKEKEKMLKDYEEEVSEYTDLMKEGINDIKDEMKNVKEGVSEMKGTLKKGFEEYKKNKKKD